MQRSRPRNLAQALERDARGQQLENAYALKDLLDRKLGVLDKLQKNPQGLKDQPLSDAGKNMREVVRQMKENVNPENMQRDFSSQLRRELNAQQPGVQSQSNNLSRQPDSGANPAAIPPLQSSLQSIGACFAKG